MFYYEPQTGVIRIPKWVYSELKDLFIVPPAFLTILKKEGYWCSQRATDIDSQMFRDYFGSQAESYFDSLLQIVLSSEAILPPLGYYRIIPIARTVTIIELIDAYSKSTHYFRPESLVIQPCSSDVEKLIEPPKT